MTLRRMKKRALYKWWMQKCPKMVVHFKAGFACQIDRFLVDVPRISTSCRSDRAPPPGVHFTVCTQYETNITYYVRMFWYDNLFQNWLFLRVCENCKFIVDWIYNWLLRELSIFVVSLFLHWQEKFCCLKISNDFISAFGRHFELEI